MHQTINIAQMGTSVGWRGLHLNINTLKKLKHKLFKGEIYGEGNVP